MSLSRAFTRAQQGIEAPSVEIEVHLSGGLPRFSVVGLPDAAVKESRDRIRSALINSGFVFPEKRLTVNLAPADLPKDGGRYDLGIALGILAASEQLQGIDLSGVECYGELSLSGDIRKIRGVLPAALASKKANRLLLIPQDNQEEAALSGVPFLAADSLKEALDVLRNNKPILPPLPEPFSFSGLDFLDVRGQANAKRALSIAASGGHHLLMIGPPGTGKSMMAARLPSILPPLTNEEALQVASVYSVSEGFADWHWRARPFRSPHHTISQAALIGGGSKIRPGEISLAHQGVLFLDELGEFSTKTLDLLRQPLELSQVHIARANARVSFPCHFQLIGAMNPAKSKSSQGFSDYQHLAHRISAPLIDRIDLHIEVPKQDIKVLALQGKKGESSEQIRDKVMQSRARQMARAGKINALLSPSELERDCKLNSACELLLSQAMQSLNLSARAYHRLIKLSRSIADFEDGESIHERHIAEAVSYRILDQTGQ